MVWEQKCIRGWTKVKEYVHLIWSQLKTLMIFDGYNSWIRGTIVTLALKYTLLYLSSFLTIVYIFCIGVNGMDMA